MKLASELVQKLCNQAGFFRFLFKCNRCTRKYWQSGHFEKNVYANEKNPSKKGLKRLVI